MIPFNLSPQQLKLLLQMAYLGDWIINSRVVPGEKNSVGRPYAEIYSLICKQAADTKCAHLVERDDESDTWYGSRKLEESVEDFLHDYDDDVFWHELIHVLARRDTVEAGYSCKKNGNEAFFEAQYPLLEKYEKEVREHGLTRLRIVPKDEDHSKH